ncbi:hypothetical protein [uncultured Chryseobacterium sp.]|uniref:energy transducer TonB n=1 Tax=uncultured Chryseobacterium sp. TaxID=259322 RepID=UPI0025FF7710|nr:hypothetical protein [uncultured Chryseobacterium sp.]
MKKLLVIFILIGSAKVFAQENTVTGKEIVSSDEIIYEKADKTPEYPGGLNLFRRNFSQNFDITKIDGTGTMKSEVQFVISKEGMITDITVTGNNRSMNKEMERTIKALSITRWKPAEIKGYPVKYKFRLPMTMNL